MVKLRGIPSAEIGVNDWMTSNLPGADSEDNDHVADVVGNKADSVAGNSVISLVKQVVAATAVLKESKLFPTLADGVVVTSSATAWTLGSAANITAVRTLDNANTSNPAGTETRIPCTGHCFNVGQVVTISGTASNNGFKTIINVSDGNHFDFDDGSYDTELFAGTELASLIITSDLNIKYISIENLSANGIYEIVIYDDGAEIGRAVAIKSVAQEGTINVPILTPVIANGSIITAKLATNNAAGDTATIRIFYHEY